MGANLGYFQAESRIGSVFWIRISAAVGIQFPWMSLLFSWLCFGFLCYWPVFFSTLFLFACHCLSSPPRRTLVGKPQRWNLKSLRSGVNFGQKPFRLGKWPKTKPIITNHDPGSPNPAAIISPRIITDIAPFPSFRAVHLHQYPKSPKIN